MEDKTGQGQEDVSGGEVQLQDREYVEELERLLTIAKHPGVVNLLKANIDKARSMNAKIHLLTSTQKAVTVTSDRLPSTATKIKEYGWDQSDKFVKVYISTIPNVDKVSTENICQQFSERGFTVEIPVERKLYALTMKDLLHSINPEQSSVKVKSGMICIQLQKKSSQSWQCLLAKDKKPDVDNDAVTKDGDDPGAGLMKLMKKMYDEGDDEMKRTITKSWFEAQQKRGKGMDEL